MCKHDLIPVIYGPLNFHVIRLIEDGSAVYGGEKGGIGFPEHWCPICMEEYPNAVSDA